MNESTTDQPRPNGSPRVPLGFPFAVIAAWLWSAFVVTLAREASVVDSLVWRQLYPHTYDSGAIWFVAIRVNGLHLGALGMLPLCVWLALAQSYRITRRRWLYAGAVTLLVATLFPVVRTAALVSQADRLLHRAPDLRLSRLSPYATQDLVLIGWYSALLLVPGGLGYAVGWAVRAARSRRLRESHP